MTRTTRISRRQARRIGLVLALGLLSACARPEDDLGLTGDGLQTPFPSSLHLDEDGRVDLALAELPATGRVSLPIERSRWRTGFSTAQPFVLRLDGVVPEALPGWRSDPGPDAAVLLVDLTDGGSRIPAMAELDAFEQDDPALIVRPLRGLPPGHEIAVVVRTAAAPRTERFDDLARGRGPRNLSRDTRDLLDQLEEAGINPDDVALAWSVPIEDGLKPTRAALEQRDPADIAWSFDEVREGDEADDLAWRSAQGTLTVTGILGEDGQLALDLETGSVSRVGTWDTELFVHIPQGVQDAPAGSVPILLYGHGIFGNPGRYFSGESGSAVPELSSDGGTILVGIPWRGLSRADLGLAAGVAGDISTLPELTGHLAQSQVAIRQLAEALRSGEILDDPVFQGASGQPLADAESLDYFGISLGGIEGTLFVGLGAPVDQAVLHVPGSMWSTMLERSSNWPVLERALVAEFTDPYDRQRLYAWTQLHWDQADPMGVAVDWPADAPPVLLQEALHDEQVPNLVTRAMARSMGLAQAGPVVASAFEVSEVDAPTAAGTSAWTQADPQRDPPPDVNRPAPVTSAHTTPRDFPGVRRQILRFLDDAVVIHPCGEAPCTTSNDGR